jgi:VWFA-related protein
MMTWRFGVAAVITVVALSAHDAVFKSDTRVVEIAVVAKDATDLPIADLRQRELRVFDNGVEQIMLSFENLGIAAGTTAGTRPTGDASSGTTPRLSIILLDALNTSVSSQIYGRKAISEMLRTLPQGENRIALFVLGDELRMLHDFSTDTASLREAVDGYEGEHPHNGSVDPPPFAGGFSLAATVPVSNKGPFPFEEERLAATLAAFTRIARNMKDVRGEKSLLWVTGGFLPPEDHKDIETATHALASSNVILFPIDARGLIACPGGACPPEVNLAIASMEEVAELTGGRAFHDDNGISALARAALDDSREGYVLTYTPNNYKQDGSSHKVQLRTSRKGVELRYRPGYIANLVGIASHL